MALVIIRNDDRTGGWVNAIRAQDPDVQVYDFREPHPKEAVKMAAVWKHPPGSLGEYPNLLGVHGLGAGVDFILGDPGLPKGLPVIRVVDPFLASDMAEYVLAQLLSRLRTLPEYTRAKQHKQWGALPYGRVEDYTIGIMGYGTLGKAVGELLTRVGFPVRGWASRSKPGSEIAVFAGDARREAFLSGCDVLVCLLPLTPQTRGILNDAVFRALPRGAFLINVARGPLLNEDDLLGALGSGQLSGACLDVFTEEPLPPDHPFWDHPDIQITPHVASVSEPASVVPQILANYRALLAGNPLQHEVSRERGY